MKQSLLLLHGALGSAKQFKSIKEELKDTFDVYSFDFDGHGNGSPTASMSIELFAMNLLDFVSKNNLQNAIVFGYSMGGYVALYLESQHPKVFKSILTLGTKFNWTVQSAEKEIQMLNPDKIKEKVPAFSAYLQEIQSPTNWEQMMIQTQELMMRLGNQPLLNLEVLNKMALPVTLCLGELDKMVSKQEATWAVDGLKNADFLELKGVHHQIQLIDPGIIIELIKSQG